MNNNHVSCDRVLELITLLNEEHLAKLERFAAKRCERHAGFKMTSTQLCTPRDLVHTAIGLVLPIDGGPYRNPHSEDLADLETFILYLKQTIWSLLANHAKRHDQRKTIRCDEAVEQSNGGQLTPVALLQAEVQETTAHIQKQLGQWAGEDKRRGRAVKRFLRVLNGGAIPKHADFREVQQVARSIYFDL